MEDFVEDQRRVLESDCYSNHQNFQTGENVDFNSILQSSGGFGKQQKILFATQCILSVFYAFIIFGAMFMTLTPPEHWCSPSDETRKLLISRMAIDIYDPVLESRQFLKPGETVISTSSTKLKRDAYEYTILDSDDIPKNIRNYMKDNVISMSSLNISINNRAPIPNDVNKFLQQNFIRRITIPRKKDGDGYEHCLMYDVNWKNVLSNPEEVIPNESWPKTACRNGWDYDFSLYYPTITSENDWVCGESQKLPFAQSMFYIGSIVGGPLFGWLADARGRKTAFISSNFLAGISGVASAMAPNFLIFCVSLFVLGFNAYPQINIIYILAMEFATSKHRSFVATVPFMVFLTLGFTILPWLAYFIANWRTLGLVMFAPLLATPLLWWGIPESVRWQMGKGNQQKAQQTLEKVAKVNGVHITESFSNEIKDFLSQHQISGGSASVFDLVKTPRLRKHFIALCFLLMSIRLLYDAHVRITQFIEYNIFITFSIASSLEVFSGLAAFILAERVGRRNTGIAMFLVSAGIELIRACLQNSSPYLQMALHFGGKLSITTAMDIAFMFPVEVLPTVARSQAVSFIHTLGFVISFASPYIVLLAESCSSCALSILAVVALVGAFTCLFLLPETRGHDLPDTLQEGEDFCRGQHRLWNRRNTEDEIEKTVASV